MNQLCMFAEKEFHSVTKANYKALSKKALSGFFRGLSGSFKPGQEAWGARKSLTGLIRWHYY